MTTPEQSPDVVERAWLVAKLAEAWQADAVYVERSMRAAIGDALTRPTVTEDLADLVRQAAPMFPITTHDAPDYAEVHFGDGIAHRSQAMTMNPKHWQALNDLFAALQAALSSDRGVVNG